MTDEPNPNPTPDNSEDIIRLQRALDASRNEFKEFKERFSGVDLEEHAKLKKQAEDIRDKKLIEEGQVEKLMQGKLADIEKDHQTQVAAYKLQLSENEKTLNRYQIAEPARSAAVALNVVPGMDKYIVQEVMEAFKFEDGQLVGRDSAGQLLLDKSGNRLAIDSYVAQLRDNQTTKHLFGTAMGVPDSGSGRSNGQLRADGARVVKDTPENRSLYIQEVMEGKIVFE